MQGILYHYTVSTGNSLAQALNHYANLGDSACGTVAQWDALVAEASVGQGSRDPAVKQRKMIGNLMLKRAKQHNPGMYAN